MWLSGMPWIPHSSIRKVRVRVALHAAVILSRHSLHLGAVGTGVVVVVIVKMLAYLLNISAWVVRSPTKGEAKPVDSEHPVQHQRLHADYSLAHECALPPVIRTQDGALHAAFVAADDNRRWGPSGAERRRRHRIRVDESKDCLLVVFRDSRPVVRAVIEIIRLPRRKSETLSILGPPIARQCAPCDAPFQPTVVEAEEEPLNLPDVTRDALQPQEMRLR